MNNEKPFRNEHRAIVTVFSDSHRFPVIPRLSPKPCGSIGAWRRRFIGSSMSAFVKMHVAFAFAKAMAQFPELRLQSLELRNPPYNFEGAMRVAKRNHAQALVVLSSPEFYRQRPQVAALTVQYRLPAIFLLRFFVQAGGLMSYGAGLYEMYRHGATYVAKILRGVRPVDLPVEQPTKFTLAINLKTAQHLGLAIPPLLFFQADEVIK